MRIILIRHGKPDINITKKLSSYDMGSWIENYDKSEVSENPPQYVFTNSLISKSFVIVSSLPRALTSLKMMDINPDAIDSVYCEAQLPSFNILALKLSPMTYAFLFRMLWFVGFSKNVESYYSAKHRSKLAATKLISFAQKESSISLMGHGIMNRMIGYQLEREGFKKTKKLGKNYWELTVYEKS
ncbi:histidine phosphatase family protein [Pectobacterium sp. A535-S3-A17]|uniref:histidine phosphatase family protein n=1 Tax=Pectobacterium quasiaquaticum TaxID=2774015 RepID=UPI0018767C50|nr:histidine phosphatase family protein [Pectobacterium quasiaquaticum]MBE5212559.1 histidine phosphatase family protein [Pectobacterium quasiaquaticum]MBE5225635.1 histidine phosphatase family protein [Pectobacterium quasiaquaticum]